jgi:hypothetical protein
MFYVAVVAINIADIATGKQPKMMLIGLPITMGIACMFFRAATRVRSLWRRVNGNCPNKLCANHIERTSYDVSSSVLKCP